jgi:hypothetical protein
MISAHKEGWMKWQSTLPPDGDKKSKDGLPLNFYRPDIVQCTEKAREEFFTVLEIINEQHRRGANSETRAALFGRVIEQAKRIAFVLAVASSPVNQVPCVSLHHADLAIRIAYLSAEIALQALAKAEEKDKPSSFNKACKRALNKINEVKATGREPTRREVQRAASVKAQDFEQILDFLIDTGEIKYRPYGNHTGRPMKKLEPAKVLDINRNTARRDKKDD